MAPGHEIAGVVTELGSNVETRRVGDRVRVHGNLICGSCVFCTTDRETLCSQASMLGGVVFGPDAVPLNGGRPTAPGTR